MDGKPLTSKSDSLPESLVFTHEAMNTTFTLRLPMSGEHEASGIAHECFELIDHLEQGLSRFIDGSDISRVNALKKGETLHVRETTHRCLLLAIEASTATSGLFDVTHGARFEHLKRPTGGQPPEIHGSLVVHPDLAAVTCIEPGRIIDLGGIGKGFALDETARLLADWDVREAFIAAGASSMLALGNARWPVDLAGDHTNLRITLDKASLSASGSGIQGSHIVHPGGSGAMPVHPARRVWVVAANATLAEVWSTTLMLVEPSGIRRLLSNTLGIHKVFAEDANGPIRLHLDSGFGIPD